MNLHTIAEPELEFSRGNHVCPRTGIYIHDVYDAQFKARRDRILMGAVGTSEPLEKLAAWIDTCSRFIPAKPKNKKPNLFVPFCGFNREVGYRATLVFEQEISRNIHNSDIRRILKISRQEERIEKAVALYYSHIKYLAQNRNVDVIVCVIPSILYDKVAQAEKKPIEETLDDLEGEDLETNFRRDLKAKSMHLGVPLQLVRESSLESNAATLQDDATKAWNFCTALYYKANQTVPWKLTTNAHQPSVCFVGISFYRSRDKQVLHSSLAQLFDELGNSVILRGTPVDVDKSDRQPHLTDEQSYDLLKNALYEYEVALENSPSRLVIHKSSNYTREELEGFREATEEMRVRAVDFVTILDTDIRLVRKSLYPPYRGTHVELESDKHLLYTRGSVKYYETYPGLYIPQPLEVRVVEADSSPSTICREILSLSKMNWNNTQFDGKYPITLQCSRKVGQIMKYLSPQDKAQINYSFYM